MIRVILFTEETKLVVHRGRKWGQLVLNAWLCGRAWIPKPVGIPSGKRGGGCVLT